MRLVRLAAALLAAAAPVAAAAQNARLELRPGETLLEVQATGTHFSRPDIMRFEAGVVTTGPTARAASQANAELAERLVEALRAAGIAARDMRTSSLRVTARFDERQQRTTDELEPRIVGYVARNTLEVRIRDLSRASAILDALIAAGANEVRGPSFMLSDEGPARRSARQRAIAAAREEAEDYAAALGMGVARVLRVSERSASLGGENYITVRGSRLSGTPVEPGEVETKVEVWVDYALTPR